MRIVLDTNVVTSALLWRGIPYELLQVIRLRSNLQLYSSAALLEELADVLTLRSLSKQLAVVDKQAADVLLDYSGIRYGSPQQRHAGQDQGHPALSGAYDWSGHDVHYQGLMHTIAGTQDPLIVLTRPQPGKRALGTRFRCAATRMTMRCWRWPSPHKPISSSRGTTICLRCSSSVAFLSSVPLRRWRWWEQ